ncbi:MAG: N-acetyltransferase [Candidatus Thiodiazotropha sp. (ex. Lucinisca nassula)]|nr:N-acetyltransferase [Candidatus Thiodiazotropha sp. (ex. Lucinisca nassula)]
MNHVSIDSRNTKDVTELFTSVFTSSEGEEEGKLIGRLVSKLAPNIDNKDIFCFGAYIQELLVGSIFLTRLRFEESHLVYMLAPVAVRTGYQAKGIGQSLIKYGLAEMKGLSVSVVVTYGDPSYYSKVGFQALSENVIQAPLELSMPEGWLGCSLTGDVIPAITERPTCVKEFNDPIYW